MKKEKKLIPYPELIKKHDKKLMKSRKKFTKSIKRIRKACARYDDPKRKIEFLYHMDILNEYDFHEINTGLIMLEEKRLSNRLARINRNSIYGMLSTDNAESLTSKSIVKDIDESSMYPTRMINVEMPKPMTGYMAKTNDPTVVKSHTIVKVRKREL